MRLSALVFALTLQATVALAQPAADVAVFYQQLEEAVAGEEWTRAQTIVTQLLLLHPERSAELTAYQQRLQRLAGSLPPLPPPSPDPVPLLLERLQIHSVAATVKSTRQEFLTTYPATSGGCPGYVLRTPVTLPDTYEVVVRVMGPVGLPTQRIPVQIAVNDRAIEITPDFLLGSQAIASYRFQFRGSQVPHPRTVRVTLPTGAARSFAVDLPSATTILKRGPTRFMPTRFSQDPCPLADRL